MDEQEIERAGESLKQQLRELKGAGTDFALIRGEVKKGKITPIRVYAELPDPFRVRAVGQE